MGKIEKIEGCSNNSLLEILASNLDIRLVRDIILCFSGSIWNFLEVGICGFNVYIVFFDF